MATTRAVSRGVSSSSWWACVGGCEPDERLGAMPHARRPADAKDRAGAAAAPTGIYETFMGTAHGWAMRRVKRIYNQQQQQQHQNNHRNAVGAAEGANGLPNGEVKMPTSPVVPLVGCSMEEGVRRRARRSNTGSGQCWCVAYLAWIPPWKRFRTQPPTWTSPVSWRS